MSKKDQTSVVFRRFRKGNKELIALLGNAFVSPATGRIVVMSYQKIGQHSEADWPNIIVQTRPVKKPGDDKEVLELTDELERVGYVLRLKQSVFFSRDMSKR